LIEADYPWEDVLKSIDELRNRQDRDIPDHVADSVAGQNILVDLRISELLDTATQLLDRAFRNPAAMAEEGAQLAQELQKIANGNSAWTPQRNDKRFNILQGHAPGLHGLVTIASELCGEGRL
jgi:hypothetical protein